MGQKHLKFCEEMLNLMKLSKWVDTGAAAAIAKTGWIVALSCNHENKVDYFIEEEYTARLAIYGKNDDAVQRNWNIMNDPIYRQWFLGSSEFRKEAKDIYLKFCTLAA